MAADDIYSATMHFEGPTSAASFGLFYQQSINHTAAVFGTEALAEAANDQLKTPVKNALSDDWHLSAIVCRLHNATVEPKHVFDVEAGVGVRLGPALPANMTWMCRQSQILFSPKSNGRVFIPGLAEGDSAVGVLTNAFATGAAAALATALQTALTEVSAGAGVWAPGVISRKVLDAAPPAKDWEGAFSQVGTVTAWTIIAHQRRRKTRVTGAKF